jgi:serine/threonine-protein kinase
LTLQTDPPSEIYLGARKLGTGGLTELALPAGRHRLRVVAPTGAVRSLEVSIGAGRTTAQAVTFGSGFLRVVVQPWANVVLDGKPIGQTPLAPLTLLEGNHQLELANPDLGKSVSQKVNIRAGQEELVRLDWR